MFRFTQTIIRELSAGASLKLQCWYRLHISIFEVIGNMAAYYVQSCYACGSFTVTDINFSEAPAKSSLMMVYINRNMLVQPL